MPTDSSLLAELEILVEGSEQGLRCLLVQGFCQCLLVQEWKRLSVDVCLLNRAMKPI